MAIYNFKINGKKQEVDARPGTPLLWVLRETLGLTGTKYGCGIAQCGSCTIHLDGTPMRACVLPVDGITEDQEITTIEGLSETAGHPLQKAWVKAQVPQCGYCHSGQIMQAAALLKENPKIVELGVVFLPFLHCFPLGFSNTKIDVDCRLRLKDALALNQAKAAA